MSTHTVTAVHADNPAYTPGSRVPMRVTRRTCTACGADAVGTYTHDENSEVDGKRWECPNAAK